jgi:S-(hydroxymethyl)glutathione dehydrogenase/alcohol dehydrogenase
MTVIKAAVLRALGQPLVVEDVTLRSPQSREVRVEVDAVAICHSDITFFDGGWGGDLPAVYGHEAAGRVVEVGNDVTEVAVGDRVVVTLIRSCGECRPCRRGRPVACLSKPDTGSPLADVDGAPIAHGLFCGAFAEQVVVHQSQVVRVDLDAAPASLLACGVVTGTGAALRSATVGSDDRVVVIGCGGVGLNVVQGARIAGAEVIVAIDPDPSKVEAARRFGATHGIDPTAGDTAQALRDICDGGLADLVFVATGAPAAYRSAADLLAVGGALVAVGMPADALELGWDPGSLAAADQRIIGSKMGSAHPQRDIAELVKHHRAGRLMLDELISGTYPLERINEAVDAVRNGSALRNVIVFEKTGAEA